MTDELLNATVRHPRDVLAKLRRRAIACAVLMACTGLCAATAQDLKVNPAAAAADVEERLKKLEALAAGLPAQLNAIQQHQIQQGNWIGQLLYRTQDQVDRVKWEAEARLFAPEFSPLELALLDRWELSTDALRDTPKAVELTAVLHPAMLKVNEIASDGAYQNYTPESVSAQRPGDLPERPRQALRIDPQLPKPRLIVKDAGTQYPTIAAPAPKYGGAKGKALTTFFEFDTRESFDSRRLWRYPALLPAKDKLNLTSPRGLTSHIFTTTLADYAGGDRVKFPFRVSAMAYPKPDDGGNLADLVKTARLLQRDLSNGDAIREVFNFVRHTYAWGTSSIEMSALDAFRAGQAGCGHINELMGAMLELNGLRVRAVAGFNPEFRAWSPGGGHTAAEVFDGTRWSFIDSFLGIYTPGVSAADFPRHPIGLRPAALADPLAQGQDALPARFGKHLTLRQLFKYRKYADKSMRLPVANLIQLRATQARHEPYPTEQTYGLQWPLRTSTIGFDPQQELPETQTIHVRARYVLSNCRIQPSSAPPCVDRAAVASEWATTSFTIRPRELLRQSATTATPLAAQQ